VRIGEDGFVSDAQLDAWVRAGDVVRVGASLASADGRRWVLTDALRVLGRRNGETDPYGLTGRVLGLRQVLLQGGALFADALRLGAAIYDVEYGAHASPALGADESGVNPIVR
jgi:hypothetical protein